MESIVLELQRDAYKNETSVSVLLRKAYTLAKKLKVDEFTKWISLELNGYVQGNEIPDYRKVHGQIKVFDPYQGYIPALF